MALADSMFLEFHTSSAIMLYLVSRLSDYVWSDEFHYEHLLSDDESL